MISTHILDTSKGVPAADVIVNLEKRENTNAKWNKIASGITNIDGRLIFNCPKEVGCYRLNFEIETYFKKRKNLDNTADFFFIDTAVAFQITNTDRVYHVPLLINPFGYTTYRGS